MLGNYEICRNEFLTQATIPNLWEDNGSLMETLDVVGHCWALSAYLQLLSRGTEALSWAYPWESEALSWAYLSPYLGPIQGGQRPYLWPRGVGGPILGLFSCCCHCVPEVGWGWRPYLGPILGAWRSCLVPVQGGQRSYLVSIKRGHSLADV